SGHRRGRGSLGQSWSSSKRAEIATRFSTPRKNTREGPGSAWACPPGRPRGLRWVLVTLPSKRSWRGPAPWPSRPERQTTGDLVGRREYRRGDHSGREGRGVLGQSVGYLVDLRVRGLARG